MFKKLYRNIYLPIMLIAVVLILFINIFSVIVFNDTLKDAHNVVDTNRISRALGSCELYINSVVLSAYDLSLDNDLIDELSSPAGKSLTNKLNDTCNYSLKINAVSAYSQNGNIYTSSQVANVPTLQELEKTDGIKNFIDGEDAEFVCLRTENIAEIYNSSAYPDGMGVVTCCRKVYKNDAVVGYVFADILPANLYDYLFANGQFENAVAFISADGFYFEYNGNKLKENLLSQPDNGYFKYSVTAEDDLFSITVFNSKQEYRSQLAILIVILASVSVGLIIGVHFAARLTAKTVTKRLDRLIDKMNSTEI